MHPLEKHVAYTIESRNLLRRSSPVIVALSGGADSVALLAVLTRLGYECIAAHCNFHLRGAESVRDMRHAEEIARKLGVDIYIREFDVALRTRKTGESVEMACRELRYRWFHQLLDRDFSQAIAVAHHREDNVETFMLNLLRSSGIKGLTGMEFRRGYIVRPFLDISRDEILQYLTDTGLTYVTDSSNNSNIYRRNRLRNVIIPLLEQHFPGAANAILAAMDHLRDSDTLTQLAVSQTIEQIRRNENTFDINTLTQKHDTVTSQILLYEILAPLGFNRTQSDNIVRAAVSRNSGLRFSSAQNDENANIAELDRGILTITSSSAQKTPDTIHTVRLTRDILSPVHIHITPHNVAEFRPTRNPEVMFLDKKALDDNPVFQIRHPKRGDRMQPFGMTGTRLVSDILTEAKLSAAQKRRTWLLTRNDQILWIIGIRASAHFTVNPETRQYLRLQATT